MRRSQAATTARPAPSAAGGAARLSRGRAARVEAALRWLLAWVLGSGVLAAILLLADRVIAGQLDAARPDTTVAIEVLSASALRLGVAAGAWIALSSLLAERATRPWLRWGLTLLAVGGAVAWALSEEVLGSFASARERGSVVAVWAPRGILLGSGLLAGGLACAARPRQAADGVGERPRLVALALSFVGGVLLLVLDQTWLVALYARLHAAIELYASLLVVAAASLGIERALPRERPWGRLSAFAAVGLSALVGGLSLRFWLEPARREASIEAFEQLAAHPYYAVRAARRATRADDGGLGGLGDARIAELLGRYGVDAVRRDPRWDLPYREPPRVAAAIDALRPDDIDFNVVVFYVDTLRYDVASDPTMMPEAAKFARSSLSFERAYSCGSDTLTALPCMIGGHYDRRRVVSEGTKLVGSHERPTLLSVARDRGVRSSLFIPESAQQFLEKLYPGFSDFDEIHRSVDHEVAGVWGYGADMPTADELVTRSLDWMSQRQGQRFFTWLFHFDVHNWRELDRRHLQSIKERHGVTEEGALHVSYRAAARGVDAAFGRLLEGLEQLGIADDTVVVFVSDHGEGLGDGGFWVHSVFLWESLIRVPLAIRVPGLGQARVTDPVSLADLTPTLARYLHPAPSLDGCHGDDLLGRLVPQPAPRRLPILASSVLQQELARVAVIDGRYKLVLPTDWGSPQLIDTEAPLPDDTDLAEALPSETLSRMATLLSSPVFVNAYEDARAAAQGP